MPTTCTCPCGTRSRAPGAFAACVRGSRTSTSTTACAPTASASSAGSSTWRGAGPDRAPVLPQRQREQAPQLSAEVLAAVHMAVEHGGNRSRIEQPLVGDAGGSEYLASEGHERAAQPRRRRNGEALLAPAHDGLREKRRRRPA